MEESAMQNNNSNTIKFTLKPIISLSSSEISFR